jgi:outer membrane immunogenic protein
MERQFLLGAAMIISLGGSAMAADLPVKARPVPTCPTCYWDGFYLGVNLGGGIGHDPANDSVSIFPPGVVNLGPGGVAPGVTNPLASASYTHSPAGAVGGGQIGFNRQFGSWVLGAEADVDWVGQTDTFGNQNFLASSVNVAPATLTYNNQQKIDWIATLRARAGWTQDCFLWYVTGGAAFGQVESNSALSVTQTAAGTGTFGVANAAAGFSTTRTGWTVGGGVETSLARWGAPNLSAKVEYLYVDLGNVSNSFATTALGTTTPGGPATYTMASSSNIRDHIIRVGLNYRFGGAGFAPAAAPAMVSAACPNCNWGGFYIGGNVGGSIGRDPSHDAVTILPTGIAGGGVAPGVVNPLSDVTFTHSPAGAIGGGQIGFNWQISKWVLGVEGDWDWSGQTDRLARQNFFASSVNVAPAQLAYNDEQKLSWLATARARAGWAQDCFLWYVTGGAAWGRVESNYALQITQLGGAPTFGTEGGALGTSTTKTGWTIGGGVETVLSWLGASNRWSGKLEYLYVDLGSVANSFTVANSAVPGSIYTFSSNSSVRDHIVRVGLNYHFGG